MNPLDLTGPELLRFYLAWGVGGLLLRGPGGGPKEAARTLLARLRDDNLPPFAELLEEVRRAGEILKNKGHQRHQRHQGQKLSCP